MTPVYRYQLEGLKRRAKKRSLESGRSHSTCLNSLAELLGYKDWTSLLREVQPNPPKEPS